MLRFVILIPFYNHYEDLNRFLPHLLALNLPLLIVNDGSSEDETLKLRQLVTDKNVRYLELRKNKGKGAAFIAGLQEAESVGFTHIIQIDADGQHNLQDLKSFMDLAVQNPQALINGVPEFDESVPRSNFWGHKFTNFWVSVETLSNKIADAMCGFRIYPLQGLRPVIPKLKFMRMGFDIEILVRSCWEGIEIINLKTKVTYPVGGVSHFKKVRDNCSISLLHTYLCCIAPFNLLRYYLRKWKKQLR